MPGKAVKQPVRPGWGGKSRAQGNQCFVTL